ncbi:DUF2809 domain-containing protein [Methylobacterium sp. E-005]|uniref:ribosomal maturation YjgA family protein n=1 Tax=Methylobacterium sp. E-005 TaxID=2836549 RepID=UPI001FB92901|nr:DUF2809 domain-containing protein [Methylobacterium sp. E-005]MCJ2090408.1 DUF2809 domain-containing protein [Methylobacterium sp. E-005]
MTRVHSTPSRPRSRPAWLALSIALIGIGLVWRLVPLGLPRFALKYGGSLLWASMVYSLSAALLPRWSIAATATVAGLVALSIELLRLYHQPWLDAFRLTLPGALLLGRIFSPWNLVAYAAGIRAAAWCEWLIARRNLPYRQPPA